MIFHDIDQNTDEWLQLRLGKATASKFACFMANDGKAFGEPAKEYALQLALERITDQRSENSFTNEHMERGKEQEPIARVLYEQEYFAEVLNGGFFDHGDYGDSPDGLIGDNGVIEIKSVTAKVHYATLTRGSFDPSYKWQLIGHLECTGRDWVDFVSYCADFPESKKLIVHKLLKNDFQDEIERLKARRDEFLKLVIETQNNIIKG